MNSKKVTTVCANCIEYLDEGAGLYLLDGKYLHVGNDSNRCPGQEDDGTDDRAIPESRKWLLRQYDEELAEAVFGPEPATSPEEVADAISSITRTIQEQA